MQLPKPRRTKLSKSQYAKLRLQILERDGWRCRICGSTQNLQVDHFKKRSQMGGDDASNLWTVCAEDHRKLDTYVLPHKKTKNLKF